MEGWIGWIGYLRVVVGIEHLTVLIMICSTSKHFIYTDTMDILSIIDES